MVPLKGVYLFGGMLCSQWRHHVAHKSQYFKGCGSCRCLVSITLYYDLYYGSRTVGLAPHQTLVGLWLTELFIDLGCGWYAMWRFIFCVRIMFPQSSKMDQGNSTTKGAGFPAPVFINLRSTQWAQVCMCKAHIWDFCFVIRKENSKMKIHLHTYTCR